MSFMSLKVCVGIKSIVQWYPTWWHSRWPVFHTADSGQLHEGSHRWSGSCSMTNIPELQQCPGLQQRPAPAEVSSSQVRIFLRIQFWVSSSTGVTDESKRQVRTSQRQFLFGNLWRKYYLSLSIATLKAWMMTPCRSPGMSAKMSQLLSIPQTTEHIGLVCGAIE